MQGVSKSISGFDPRSIPGCSLWLDGADAGSITGTTTVTKWSDKSGSGNNFTPSAGTVSTSTDSGYPVVNFPSGAIMSSANQITFTPASAFYTVFRQSTLSGQGLDYVIGFTNATVGQTGDQGIRIGGSGLYGAGTLTGGAQDVGNSNYYVNGNFNPSYPLSTYSNSFVMVGTTVCSSTTTSYITISTAFSVRYFIGSMCELLYYPGGLTTTQRQSVEGYLAWKWGLQVQSPAPVQTPPSISSCVLWLDAADASTVTGTSTVTAWRDKSSKGYNFIPGTGTTSYANSAITVNTSYLYANGLVDLTTFTFFIVVKTITTNGNQPYFGARPGTGDGSAISRDGFGWYMDNGNQTRFMGNYSVSGQYILTTGLVTSNTALYSITGTSAGVYTQWNNGVLGNTATYLSRTSSAAGFMVGTEWGGSAYYTYTNSGSIYEVVVYNSVLSTSQRQSVENYLMGKWGIKPSLPAIHPFYSIPSFSRPFGPLDIPGCALWLDGADASTITGTTTVTKWSDKSGSGNNFTPSAGTVSTSTDSGYPVVNFPSGAIMTSANQITFTPASAFYVVFRLTTMNGQGLSMVLAFPNATVGQTGDCSIRLGTTGLVGSGTITGGVQDVGNSNYYVNGNFNPSYPLSTYSNSFAMIGTTVCSSTTTSYIALSSSFSVRYFIGNVCEVLYYPGGLTTTQRQQVEGYLAAKWGLQSNLPGATFSPLTVSGCVLWLDAADASTVTGTTTVTAWRDKSAKAYTLAPGTGTTSYASNAITINSSYLYATGAVDLTTFTFFIVAKNNNTNTNIPLFAARPNTSASYNSTDGFSFYLDNQTSTRFYGGYPTAGQSITTTGLTTSTATLFSVTGTSAGVFQQWNNGAIGGTATYTTRTSTAQGFSVGGEWGGSSYTTYSSSSSIYEVVVYNSVLTTSQRQSIENYLMRKWGISNITTHPFKSIPPSTSQPPQFQEVTPGNWKYDWQPYLSNLIGSNNSANSTVIPTVAYGTGGASLSPALSTQTYIGGVLGPNGNIYCMPYGSTNILIINTTTNGVSYGTGGASLSPALSTQSYGGGVLGPNGNIYCVPSLSSNILIINTSSNSVSYGTGGPSLSPALSTQNYFGGVLGPNGNIYCMPYYSASNILIINTSSNSVSYGTGGASLSPALSTQNYGGGILGPNGNIYCPPNLSANILIINTSDNSVKYGTGGASLSPALSTQSYSGGVLAPNGTIYCAPYGAANILMINTSSNSVSYGTGGASLSPALSTQYYSGAILAPNGNIYCIPKAAANVLIINTSTNAVSYGTGGASLSPALSGQTYYGGVLAPNGTIYCIPGGAANILRISNTYTANPSSNYCLSPWTNKL